MHSAVCSQDGYVNLTRGGREVAGAQGGEGGELPHLLVKTAPSVNTLLAMWSTGQRHARGTHEAVVKVERRCERSDTCLGVSQYPVVLCQAFDGGGRDANCCESDPDSASMTIAWPLLTVIGMVVSWMRPHQQRAWLPWLGRPALA